VLYIILLVATASQVHGQSVQQVEQDILGYLSKIQYWRYEYSAEDTNFSAEVSPVDTIEVANRELLQYFLKVGVNNQTMLSAPFNLLEKADIKIVTSPDKKMRIYSWDTHTGGTMHFFNTVAQYETGSGVTITEIRDKPEHYKDSMIPGNTYNLIYTMADKSGKKYYLPVYTAIYSTKDVMKGIRAFSIENGKLLDAEIFKATNKTLSRIEYGYDYMTNYSFKKMKEEYTLYINKQKLYIPVVEGEKITGRWLIYVWNGEQFVFDKNAK